MAGVPVNATGWTELLDGDLVGAAFTMYDTALAGWTVVILFFVYQFMLYLKVRNPTLAWVTGIIFAGLYATSAIVKSISLQVMFIILVLELGAILYMLIWK